MKRFLKIWNRPRCLSHAHREHWTCTVIHAIHSGRSHIYHGHPMHRSWQFRIATIHFKAIKMKLHAIHSFGKLVCGATCSSFILHETILDFYWSDFSFVCSENPNTPLLNLKPPCPIICLEYNPKDATCLVGGFHSGQVGIFDTRAEKSLVGISEREVCHQEAVNSVLWINSKSGTEFFSGSFDGQIIW